jgi:hypothetical protein
MSAHLAHAPVAVGSGPPAGPGCVPSVRRCRRLSTRRPKRLNSAGSSVIVASTVRATVSVQAIASGLRKPKLSTRMPSSAMHTVPPANKTVRPEVLSAVTAASSGVSPASRPRRYLATMNSA